LRNDQAATLYYVEAIDAGNPENKVDFRDEVWQCAFRPKCFACAKTKQRFSGYLGNATTAIAFDEWYDTRNTKPIYSIRQMPLKIPK
jgi:TPR repeat protein